MPSNPEPDEYGRYRVRRKGDTSSDAWSTRNYDPDRHVIVSGPASTTYGTAWPPKPHRTWNAPTAVPPLQSDADPAPENNTTEETQ